MRTKLFILNFVLILFISIAFLLAGCTKQQETETTQSQKKTEAEMSLTEKLEQDVQDVIKPLDQKGTELKKEMDDLLFKIKNYEQTLVEKQKELALQADSLIAKEQKLVKKEGSLKSYRTASWIIFWIGLALFITGLILFLVARNKTASQRAGKKSEKNLK